MVAGGGWVRAYRIMWNGRSLMESFVDGGRAVIVGGGGRSIQADSVRHGPLNHKAGLPIHGMAITTFPSISAG